MSKQANKKAIGAFVVAALALAVAAIVVFGSGKFFVERYQFVAFFHGSVKGLRVGAPVVFRGVKIGEVTKMMIYADRSDPSNRSFEIPVILEIEENNVHSIGPEIKDRKQYVQALIESGLRAQLQMQSLVTGQLMVNIDFYPDTPVRLIGTQKISLARGVMELPTIQTPLQKLGKTLEEIPLGEIVKSFNSSLKAIEALVTSEELTKSLHYLKQSMQEIRDLVRHVDEKIDPLSADLDQTLKDARSLFQNANSHVDPLAVRIQKTADAARQALKEAERALSNVADLTAKGSEERKQIDRTLKEFQAAARSIKLWADYLERHPEALIRGRGKSRRR
jgi:paraquat-inducible protein B